MKLLQLPMLLLFSFSSTKAEVIDLTAIWEEYPVVGPLATSYTLYRSYWEDTTQVEIIAEGVPIDSTQWNFETYWQPGQLVWVQMITVNDSLPDSSENKYSEPSNWGTWPYRLIKRQPRDFEW